MPDLSPDVERELEALDAALAGRRVAPDLTALADLALLLRDDRPAPSDSFGRYLDNRMERGFPGRDPRSRASGRRWLRRQAWIGPGLAAGLAALFVGVVIALPGADDDSGGGGGSATVANEESGGGGLAAARDSAGGADESAPSASGAQSLAPAPSPGSRGSDGRAKRKVERSASITLATRPGDIDSVSARIQDVTRQQGGFVVASSVRSSRAGGGGEFELRIPARNLDAGMAALARLGAVRDRADRSQDITAESLTARSRLEDARTERKSLLEQLAGADTVQETASIRARLRIVSGEIARARAEVRRLSNRAAFSTVAVTLVADRSAIAPGAEEDDGSWSPGDAAHDALRVLEVVVGVGLIALMIAIPLALVGLAVWLAARFTRRRRREHALDTI
jgi:Domain of unknown function (DUF4349)